MFAAMLVGMMLGGGMTTNTSGLDWAVVLTDLQTQEKKFLTVHETEEMVFESMKCTFKAIGVSEPETHRGITTLTARCWMETNTGELMEYIFQSAYCSQDLPKRLPIELHATMHARSAPDKTGKRRESIYQLSAGCDPLDK